MTDQLAIREEKEQRAALCWICGRNEANSREHKTKRSDLAAVLGSPTQGSPFYYHDLDQQNKPVGSLNAKILKAPIQICHECNSARTQPHDRAWEHMSNQLRNRKLVIGQWVRTNRLFNYDTQRQMINVHLFFVKQFGCMLCEAKAMGHDVPIDIQPFSAAIMTNRPHPEVYLEFGKYDGTVGRSNLECFKTEHDSVFAGWLYELDGIAVNVLFEQSGRWEHKPGRWHPNSPTSPKRLKIEDFTFSDQVAATRA